MIRKDGCHLRAGQGTVCKATQNGYQLAARQLGLHYKGVGAVLPLLGIIAVL